MTDAKARGRGRPREYDEAAVLDAVIGVFWRKGFSGASLPDLAEAAGITRPSLYTAVGDKLSMYLRSLEHFKAALEQQLSASLDASRPLAEGLTDFYFGGIDLYLSGGDQPRGCLAICTASTEAVEEPEIRKALRTILDMMDNAFEQRFSQALGPGKRADAKPLAAMASATLHSLAVRARAGQPRDRLVALASTTANLLAASLVL